MSEIFHGAESVSAACDRVRLHVSLVAGMSTAEFTLGSRVVAPYSLSPWLPDEIAPEMPALLRLLRGEFLCLPFGPQDDGPPHGAVANERWELARQEPDCLELTMQASDTGARVSKEYRLHDGQAAIYYTYRIRGLAGRWSYGTHPVLDCSSLPAGKARVSVSPFRWGSVYPGWFSPPEAGEQQALLPNGKFSDLAAVPLREGGSTDLTRWPARPGNDDLVMMVNEPATAEQPFAWSAVVLDDCLWFCLKDPVDFPATCFWMSNGGRPGEPWKGRHVGRLGVEEVCSHFSDGVAISRQDKLPGIPTTRQFHPEKTVELRTLHAMAETPTGFGKVVSILPLGLDKVCALDEHKNELEVCVNWKHILSKP